MSGAQHNTDRRTVLTVAAGLAVATATMGLAIGVVESTTLAPDQVHDLLANYVAACRLADAALADCQLNTIEGRSAAEMDRMSWAAYLATVEEIKAARALDGMATTADGLRAYAAHRGIERHRKMDGTRVPTEQSPPWA